MANAVRTPRIVTLIPSATELVCGLGMKDHLVGRSHECDFPAGVEALPVVSAPKIAVDGDSRTIDRSIKELVEQGLSVYAIDGEALRALRPDVIVTQSQCEVCAVSERQLAEAVQDWLDGDATIVSLEPGRLDDIWRDCLNLAEVLGVGAQGRELVSGLRGRMDGIRLRTEKFGSLSGNGPRPRVACIEWIDPPMAAGNWMPELVAMAGGDNLFGEAGAHSPWLEWDAFRAADPEIIIVMPCGWDIARASADMTALERRPGWAELDAVRNGRVFIIDGHQYFNRPGPRLVESLEILAEILHPTLFDFGHEGRGWVRASASPVA